MRIVFLPSCKRDLAWFRRYYGQVFPEGGHKARDQYERTKRLLRSAPYAGHPVEGTELRFLSVSRSPFAFVYRVKPDVIEILRVWDQRSKRPDKWT